MSDIHPLVSGGEPPGDWEHSSVSSVVGITYRLPTGVDFKGIEVPEGECLEVTLDIQEDESSCESPVVVWYVVYPPDRIMYNWKDEREVIGVEPSLYEACEVLEDWMRVK